MGEVRARLGCAALTLTLLVNLFPAAARAGSMQSCPQGTLCSHEAAIGTIHYDTLEEAVSAAAYGQTIILQTNVELEAQVDLPDGVTLDGRGRKISVASDTWSSANPGKYMLVGGDQVTIQDVTLDGGGVAAGCLQFFKARGGSLQGFVTLKNARGLGLNINASQVTAEGILTLKGNGWGDIINVSWGSNVSGVDRCSFDGSAAALEGVAAVYTDHSDVRNAGGDLEKFSILLPASFAAASEGELSALGKAILYAPAAAEVEGTGYLSLAGAFQAAPDGSTITLRASSAGNGTISLSDGRELILDLNGFDVGFAQGQTLQVENADLTLTGRGKLYEQQPQSAPVTLLGSDSPHAEGHSTLTVGRDVTLEGWSGVWIGPGEEGENAFGVSAAIYGTVISSAGGDGGHAVHLSDSMSSEAGNVPQLRLEGATLMAPGGTGLYLGGYAQTTVNSSSIRAEAGGTGVVLSAGELAIHGNTVVTGGSGSLETVPSGDGSDAAHVALAVVQRSEAMPVVLTVTGGDFTGSGALLEQNAQNGDPAAAAKVNIDISGGRFHGQVYSENQTGFISGGTFTVHPGPYLADGFAAEDSGDPVYHYTVTAAGQNPAQVIAGEAAVSVSDAVSEEEAQALAQQVAQALKDTQQGGGEKPDIGEALRAAASTVANQNPVTPEQGKQALDLAGIPSDDVTIVVRPYLEIAVADVSVQGGNQTVTLDITPKYITLAATDLEDIQLEDGAKNAVQMGMPQELTITKPVTVTLPLTQGFAENGRLYVKHEKDSGAVYYYRGTVTDNVLTFTNPNGFSLFYYSTATEVVADVNGQGFVSLEAAVAAVEEGGVIEALSHSLSAVVTREIRFTITGAGADTVLLTAGPGYEKKQVGNTYVFTYVGGGSDGPGIYPIQVKPSEHGSVTTRPGQAGEGTTVTVVVTPDTGYFLDKLTVTGQGGSSLKLTDLGDGQYTFVMPDEPVTVEAAFVQTELLPFADVVPGSWYYEGVRLVCGRGLMAGIGPDRFGVDDTATRAMIWTILAAYDGCSTAGGTPWYAPGQQWAAANGVSDGTNPNAPVTREQLAVMMWRVAGSPDTGSLSGCADADQISSWAQTAMAWAVEQGILSGVGGGILAPQLTATRAQLAVMLMQFVRCMEQ